MKNILAPVIFAIFSLMLLTPAFQSCRNPDSSGNANSQDTLKGKISLSGAFALYPLVVRWSEEFRKIHPHVTINVSAGGAGKGMTDALSKMVDLGMFSKELSPEERAKGAWWIPVAKDAVLPTINAANPVLEDLKLKGLTRQKLHDIFIKGTITTWGQAIGSDSKVNLQPFSRSDACGAAEMWSRFLGGKSQEDLQGLGLNGDPGVADAVRKSLEGIGYNNMNFIFDMQTRDKYPGLEIVPIDLNANGIIDPDEGFYESLDSVMDAINDGRYPSPPARDLYLVSGGKPVDPLVIFFLRWVLTEGQQYVQEAGYVSITPEKITSSLEKLD
jgi:phosphate transport system substrate-binding protein